MNLLTLRLIFAVILLTKMAMAQLAGGGSRPGGGGGGTGNMSTTTTNVMSSGSSIDAASADRTRPIKSVADMTALAAVTGMQTGDFVEVTGEAVFKHRFWTGTAWRPLIPPSTDGCNDLTSIPGEQAFNFLCIEERVNTWKLGRFGMTMIAPPANPPAGDIMPFANSVTGKLDCIKSDGSSCMPVSVSTLTMPIELPVLSRNDTGSLVALNSGWYVGSTGPTASAVTGATVSAVMLNFTEAATESVAHMTTRVRLPSNWTGTAPTLKFNTLTINATPSGDMAWQVHAACTASGETVHALTYNSSAVQAAAVPATQFFTHEMSFTVPITGCTAGKLMFVRIQRLRANALDTTTQDVGVIHAQLLMPLSVE